MLEIHHKRNYIHNNFWSAKNQAKITNRIDATLSWKGLKMNLMFLTLVKSNNFA